MSRTDFSYCLGAVTVEPALETRARPEGQGGRDWLPGCPGLAPEPQETWVLERQLIQSYSVLRREHGAFNPETEIAVRLREEAEGAG